MKKLHERQSSSYVQRYSIMTNVVACHAKWRRYVACHVKWRRYVACHVMSRHLSHMLRRKRTATMKSVNREQGLLNPCI